ncbi:MAG TPA: DUF1269 domain-containing protein [Coriobacteriia bacterium]
MAEQADVPVELYVAAYDDPDAAQGDWDVVKSLAKDKVITVDALILVTRDEDGKIDVKDDFHQVGRGAGIGVGVGVLVGLIFPPSILAAGLVGAGLGAGVGGLRSHALKEEIRDEVADDLPPGSSGIVVLFEPRWLTQIQTAIANASSVATHEIDADSAREATAAASEASEASATDAAG